MEATVKYSPQQQAVIDEVATTNNNLLIQAVAGSGKTSNLFGCLEVIPADKTVAVCAYNKKISVEFENKLSAIKDRIKSRVFTGTVHKFGWASWRRLHRTCVLWGDDKSLPIALKHGITPEQWKSSKINYLLDTNQVPAVYHAFVRKAYDLARQWGAGILAEFPYNRGEAWFQLVNHFDLRDEFEDAEGNLPDNIDLLVKESINWTVVMMKKGQALAPKFADFEDMIYMPLRNNIAVWQYDVVMVDEAQDINPTRRAYIKRMLKVGGRAIFVGDPRQAIYGFTGADAKSFQNIKTEFNCKEFGLTWSFRCPQNVVKYAQRWVNHSEARPEAPEGIVRSISADDIYKENLGITDAIICRNNAPLVELFFALLKRGIASHIEGRDIGAGLVKLIDRYKVKSITALETKMENYLARVTQKATATGKEQKAALLNDQVECIKAIIQSLGSNATVADLKSKIFNMFYDDENGKQHKPTLTLTSSHKSKGREWQRVFWWGPNRFNPSPYARQDWQKEQEDNLCYVTVTRSQNELIDVAVARS